MRSVLLLALLGLTGCPGGCSQEMDHGGQNPNADAGGNSDGDAAPGHPCFDAGVFDASPYDASPFDAGVFDASPYDGGPIDAGDPCHEDRPDAGPDAGE